MTKPKSQTMDKKSEEPPPMDFMNQYLPGQQKKSDEQPPPGGTGTGAGINTNSRRKNPKEEMPPEMQDYLKKMQQLKYEAAKPPPNQGRTRQPMGSNDPPPGYTPSGNKVENNQPPPG